MKFILIAIAAVCLGFSLLADQFRLEGKPFLPSTNSEIILTAPTNNLPRGLWIYKVMPEAISAAVVFNAMALGQFKMKDVSKGDSPLMKDKNLIYFFKWNQTNRLRRFLYIAPTLGAIDYKSEYDTKAPIEDVPTSDEAVTLGRDVLFQLGVDRSLLNDRVKTGYDETITKYDRNRQQIAGPQVNSRGVSFSRRVDGIPLSDNWSFLIHFGNHGAIEDYSFFWRNLLPQESHRALSAAEIVEMVKTGQSVLPPQYDDTSGLNDAKSFTITEIAPRYDNGLGRQPLDFLRPYAELKVEADFGSNTSTFFLKCPILSTNAAF